jgi:hypothetical protein
MPLAAATYRSTTKCTFVPDSAKWRELFAGVADKYTDYEGPDFYVRGTGKAWDGMKNKGDPLYTVGNEHFYAPIVADPMPDHCASDGVWVTDRSQYREALARTNTYPRDTGLPFGTEPKGYTSNAVAEKVGKTVNHEWVEELDDMKNQQFKSAGINADGTVEDLVF